MRKVIAVILIVAVIALAGPFVTGLLVQHQYRQLVAFYNAQPYVHAVIKDYQRHWFTSDVVLSVQFKGINWQKYADYINAAVFPDVNSFTVTMRQHIQHGPLFYQKNVPYVFGLAVIENKIMTAPQVLEKIFADLSKQTSASFISLRGNFYTQFSLGKINMPLQNDVVLKVEDFSGNSWLYPNQDRVSGVIKCKNLSFADENNAITIPKIKVKYDQHVGSYGMWLGEYRFILSQIILKEIGATVLTLNDIKMTSNTAEEDGLIGSDKSLRMKNIMLENNETAGPFRLDFKAENISAKGIADLIKTYEDIMLTGELYETQLAQKISAAIPHVATAGTKLSLAVALTTQKGDLKGDGVVTWLSPLSVKANNFPELIRNSQGNLSLVVNKELTTEILDYASGMPEFVDDVARDDQEVLLNARNQLELAVKQNQLVLDSLVSKRLLSRTDGEHLLLLQSDLIHSQDYVAEVKKLLLTKKITLGISYVLYWYYAQIQQPYDFLLKKVDGYQQIAKEQLQEQLDDMIKQDYITQKKHDYYFSINWSDGDLRYTNSK